MSFQTGSTNTGKAGSAFSGSTRESGVDGNTSGAAGSRGGPVEGAFSHIAYIERHTHELLDSAETTTAQEMGITMGNDARIRTSERESDHTEPNVLPGESMSTAGAGGDYRHREAQSHEVSRAATCIRPCPRRRLIWSVPCSSRCAA
jgi:hypothetical protein